MLGSPKRGGAEPREASTACGGLRVCEPRRRRRGEPLAAAVAGAAECGCPSAGTDCKPKSVASQAEPESATLRRRDGGIALGGESGDFLGVVCGIESCDGELGLTSAAVLDEVVEWLQIGGGDMRDRCAGEIFGGRGSGCPGIFRCASSLLCVRGCWGARRIGGTGRGQCDGLRERNIFRQIADDLRRSLRGAFESVNLRERGVQCCGAIALAGVGGVEQLFLRGADNLQAHLVVMRGEPGVEGESAEKQCGGKDDDFDGAGLGRVLRGGDGRES